MMAKNLSSIANAEISGAIAPEVPVRAVFLERLRASASGDRNLLLHAAQELGASEIAVWPFSLAPFQEEKLKILKPRAAESPAPLVTLFLQFNQSISLLQIKQAKKMATPAFWIALSNDIGLCTLHDKNIPWASAVDLLVCPASRRPHPISPETSANKLEDPQGIENTCYLDALPSAKPTITKDQALRYFQENHDLTLRSPVLAVSLGDVERGSAEGGLFSRTDLQHVTEAALAHKGTVLVTTGPRTAHSIPPQLKSKSLRNPASLSRADSSQWHSLYERAELFHVFSPEGENPYRHMLAAADRGIATSDSMSTPSDFVAARVPLALTPGECWSAFPAHLIAQGFACELDGARTVWPALDPNRPLPADIMRAHVSTLMQQKFGVRLPPPLP